MLRLATTTVQKRSFASVKGTQPHVLNAYQVFDRRAKQLQKDRGASGNGPVDNLAVDYLREEVAQRMFERFLVSAPLFFRSVLSHRAL
jgi:NADH dehydrogenase [ubiquinone] 1 alpha subcomplex assembly factor 5